MRYQLVARIVAVADVYDALVSERPYKHAWPLQTALDYMAKQRGIHFDPECLDAFKAEIDTILKIQQMLPDLQISNYK